MSPPDDEPVVSIRDLHVSYGDAHVVRGVDLTVRRREVVALIGETGSGKTSLALAVARLLPASARLRGTVTVGGLDLTSMGRARLRRARGSLVGYVPQDAMAALNPVLRVGAQIAEIYRVHRRLGREEARRQAVVSLRRVRIPDPEAVARLYPHQLSGGMRQRVMVAMALALEPPLLVADEPTTALDVSTQAEVLRLVAQLRHELGTAILWITHDMGVVAELADTVAVMYAGRIVERGPAALIFEGPCHPYTAALLRTLQDLRSGGPREVLYQMPGDPPSPDTPIGGCRFRPRCPRAVPGLCGAVEPALDKRSGWPVACHNPLGLAAPERP